jgi:hypothetical protein
MVFLDDENALGKKVLVDEFEIGFWNEHHLDRISMYSLRRQFRMVKRGWMNTIEGKSCLLSGISFMVRRGLASSLFPPSQFLFLKASLHRHVLLGC